MEKEFAPYDLVLRMKALGFNESCFGYYDIYDDILRLTIGDEVTIYNCVTNRFENTGIKNYNSIIPYCSAPTFSQAFRWFRKEYKLSVSISLISQDYFYEIRRDGEQFIDKPDSYNTYEEAELVCLQELIEIVEVR